MLTPSHSSSFSCIGEIFPLSALAGANSWGEIVVSTWALSVIIIKTFSVLRHTSTYSVRLVEPLHSWSGTVAHLALEHHRRHGILVLFEASTSIVVNSTIIIASSSKVWTISIVSFAKATVNDLLADATNILKVILLVIPMIHVFLSAQNFFAAIWFLLFSHLHIYVGASSSFRWLNIIRNNFNWSWASPIIMIEIFNNFLSI